MIIVTGCDNTGKTSLINHLSNKFDIPIATRFNPLPPKTQEDYLRWFYWSKENMENPNNKIHDRFLIDEFVYGPVKRGKYGCSLEQMVTLSQMLLLKQPLYIYTEIPLKDLLSSFLDRQQYIKASEVEKIICQFHKVNSSWPINHLNNMAWFNYKNDLDYTMIDSEVEEYLREGRI